MRMDAQEIKQRLAGQWAQAIAALCNVDPSILDGEHHPCPKCGGRDRFNLDRDGTGASYCNNCPGGPQVASSGIDTVMWLNGWDFPRACKELREYLSPRPIKVSDESRKIRHDIYSRLEKLFGLSGLHSAALVKRGLSKEEIASRGYWSLHKNPAMLLVKEFPSTKERQEISKSVPGVMPGGSLEIVASECLMIPVRDRQGRILGIQSRPDKLHSSGSKYFWLSSKKHGVPASPECHFPLPPIGLQFDGKLIRLTEGPLKADIASVISGIQTLAVAGVGSWAMGTEAIKASKPELVLLAFDSDFQANHGVAKAVVSVFDFLREAEIDVRLEVWSSEYKGIDDVLAARQKTTVLSEEETKRIINKLRELRPEKQKTAVKKLKNFKMVKSESDNPNKAWDKQPLLVSEIAADLMKFTDGWPKCCNGQLFVKTESGEIRRFTESSQLFGWISSKMPVEFPAAEGCITKKEFYSELPFSVERFEDTEELPHFPPRPNIFYSKSFEPGTGEYLEKFLDFFSPSTEWDRELILAFIATTLWGGAPGRRVCFGIDSISGTGAGKSELVKRVSSLTGGNYEFDAKDLKEESIRKALMNGQKHRVALLDNVKESCLSSSIIESLVTSGNVAGHRLNIGYGSRPNTITWAVTMNGMSLSRDLAQRTVVIKLMEPVRTGTWEDNLDQFIEQYREKIISDIAGFFKRPQAKLSRFTRWASWEKAIVSRLRNPDYLQKLIESRSKESDEDKLTAESIKEYFSERLQHYNFDPENDKVHIPNEILRCWLTEATGKEFSQRSALAYTKQLIDGGSIKIITQNKSRKKGRGWIWDMNRSGDQKENVTYCLSQKIEEEKNKKFEEDRSRRSFF